MQVVFNQNQDNAEDRSRPFDHQFFSLTSSIRLNAQLALDLRHADSKEDDEEIEKGKTFWATHGVVVLQTLFKVICAKLMGKIK